MIKKLFKVNRGKRLFGSILDKASLRTVRICISGGGPLAPSVFRQYNQLGIDFVQGYGLTETSPIIALNPPEAYVETSVGRVVPGAQMRILTPDADGRGEILVKGPMVMRGYYKNPAATPRSSRRTDGCARGMSATWTPITISTSRGGPKTSSSRRAARTSIRGDREPFPAYSEWTKSDTRLRAGQESQDRGHRSPHFPQQGILRIGAEHNGSSKIRGTSRPESTGWWTR